MVVCAILVLVLAHHVFQIVLHVHHQHVQAAIVDIMRIQEVAANALHLVRVASLIVILAQIQLVALAYLDIIYQYLPVIYAQIHAPAAFLTVLHAQTQYALHVIQAIMRAMGLALSATQIAIPAFKQNA